jgi:hypothetical protein
MNPLTGRFVSMDPENGIVTDPKTLHKYIYADGDPVNLKDPTGRYANTGTMGGGEGEYAGVTSFVIQAVEAAAPVIVAAETCVLLYEATKTLAEVSGGPFAQIVPASIPCTVKAVPKCDPPVGTTCMEKNTGHTHNGWDPHYHLWKQGYIGNQCHWDKIGGSKGGINFPYLDCPRAVRSPVGLRIEL